MLVPAQIKRGDEGSEIVRFGMTPADGRADRAGKQEDFFVPEIRTTVQVRNSSLVPCSRG